MNAAFINNHGTLDQIKIGNLNVPAIAPTDILIAGKFAALNHLDIFVVKGWPGLKLRMPHIIGADGSGIVEEIGSEVTTVEIGDQVVINPGISCGKCGMCLSGNQVFCKQFSIKGEHEWGTFSEYFKIPEINVYKIPKGFPLKKASAVPLTFITAYRMLTTLGKVKPGELVLIHGAGGGVSSAAIQIAKHFGAKVITTTSTTEKGVKAKQLGADHIINYKEMNNFSKFVYIELTKKQGIDLVIDNVGSATFNTSIQLLKPGGRLITCGGTSGSHIEVDIAKIFWKHLVIKGSTMGNQGEFRAVMDLVVEGKLNPLIDRIFPLDEVLNAELYLSRGKQFGKVLLEMV